MPDRPVCWRSPEGSTAAASWHQGCLSPPSSYTPWSASHRWPLQWASAQSHDVHRTSPPPSSWCTGMCVLLWDEKTVVMHENVCCGVSRWWNKYNNKVCRKYKQKLYKQKKQKQTIITMTALSGHSYSSLLILMTTPWAWRFWSLLSESAKQMCRTKVLFEPAHCPSSNSFALTNWWDLKAGMQLSEWWRTLHVHVFIYKQEKSCTH